MKSFKNRIELGLLFVIAVAMAILPLAYQIKAAGAEEPDDFVMPEGAITFGYNPTVESDRFSLLSEDEPGVIGEPWTPELEFERFIKIGAKKWNHLPPLKIQVLFSPQQIVDANKNPVAGYMLRNKAGDCVAVATPSYFLDYSEAHQILMATQIAGLCFGVPHNNDEYLSVMNPIFIFFVENPVITARDQAIYNIFWVKGYHLTLPNVTWGTANNRSLLGSD